MQEISKFINESFQIFHRCIEGSNQVYSFICPQETAFDQRSLVCVWNDTYSFHCENSEDYFEESNRAFNGNITAESNINQNMKNSTEITDIEVDDVDSDETMQNIISENIKKLHIPAHQELEIVNVEEKFEKIEQETEESNEFQAELIPSTFNQLGIDASIAASSSEPISEDHPQKIKVSVLDPIIEMPSQEDQLPASESTRSFRKRSDNHRNRFLFKADAQ